MCAQADAIDFRGFFAFSFEFGDITWSYDHLRFEVRSTSYGMSLGELALSDASARCALMSACRAAQTSLV